MAAENVRRNIGVNAASASWMAWNVTICSARSSIPHFVK